MIELIIIKKGLMKINIKYKTQNRFHPYIIMKIVLIFNLI